MKAKGVGIIGMGTYLPPEIRTNDFWSVDEFKKNEAVDIGAQPSQSPASLAEDDPRRIVWEEMGKWKDDPFHGARERRVLANDLKSSDMEVAAAKAAIADAGLQPSDIGLLLIHSFLPDRAVPGNAGPVHKRLGLAQNIAAIGVDGVCGTFPFQLQLGAAYIMSGAAKYVLLIQSALHSRCLDHSKPLSVTFGDASTAVVLGPVGGQSGLLSCLSFNDGAYSDTAVLASEPDEPWYAGRGRLIITSCDVKRTRQMVLEVGAMARMAIGRALEDAELSANDVDFFTSNQTLAAFNGFCRRAAGLMHCKYIDTFSQVASIGSATIPYNLQVARREGMLKPGSIVTVFTPGGGLNWSAAVFRWH